MIEAATRFGLDPALIQAVIRVESGGNPAAVGAAGEIGLMQITEPVYAQAVSAGVVDAEPWYDRWNPLTDHPLLDPRTNIHVGAWYLASLIRQYGSVERGLSAYNSGRPSAYESNPIVGGYVTAVLGKSKQNQTIEWGLLGLIVIAVWAFKNATNKNV